ncbi:hypothetical protein HYG86_12930 [Alkalicella caledoniensis]|uniref:Uncharacterized protein n=1 Tax=Alkalicella caledoniensis TaxID=2731377 RepID=A0A7G9WAA0_ALKCA|nr:hypothetical protein [Alkalicella caledoniensis]QNO15612.1 hypothetical protein HYG86_12930 [Alkalicella caledoniensis]
MKNKLSIKIFAFVVFCLILGTSTASLASTANCPIHGLPANCGQMQSRYGYFGPQQVFGFMYPRAPLGSGQRYAVVETAVERYPGYHLLSRVTIANSAHRVQGTPVQSTGSVYATSVVATSPRISTSNSRWYFLGFHSVMDDYMGMWRSCTRVVQ